MGKYRNDGNGDDHRIGPYYRRYRLEICGQTLNIMSRDEKTLSLQKTIRELKDYIKNYLRGRPMKPFYRQKTFWAAVLLAGTVFLPAFVPMAPQKMEAIRVMLIAIMAIFMRQGVEK